LGIKNTNQKYTAFMYREDLKRSRENKSSKNRERGNQGIRKGNENRKRKKWNKGKKALLRRQRVVMPCRFCFNEGIREPISAGYLENADPIPTKPGMV